MDKKQFVELLGNPAKFSSQDRGWLRAVLDRYPYSSVINVLALLADHAHGFDTPEQRRAAMLAMSDSSALEAMLNRAASANDAPSFDVFNEINTFQEVSFKTPRVLYFPISCRRVLQKMCRKYKRPRGTRCATIKKV